MSESLIKRLSRAPSVIAPVSPSSPAIRRWATPFEHGDIEILKSDQTTRDTSPKHNGQTRVEITLVHNGAKTVYSVLFDSALGVRLLGPRDTLAYWEARVGIPNSAPEKTANSFIVENAPWSKESPLLFRAVKLGKAVHHVIANNHRVVEVISETYAKIRSLD